MKREKNRILLTLKEAAEIEDLLDSLTAMSGVYAEDFNKECHRAEKYADKLMRLQNKQYVEETIGERLTIDEEERLQRFYQGLIVAGTTSSMKIAETLENIFGKESFNENERRL